MITMISYKIGRRFSRSSRPPKGNRRLARLTKNRKGIKCIRKILNVLIKIMMNLDNGIIRNRQRGKGRIGKGKIMKNRRWIRIKRENRQRNEINRLRMNRRERKGRLMENNIPRKKNSMGIKIKKFIPFDIKRISKKNTSSNPRSEFVLIWSEIGRKI